MSAHHVTLTDDEMRVVETEAVRRYEYDDMIGARGRNGGPTHGSEALRMDRLGCVGEYAVAKLLGITGLVFKELSPKRGTYDLPWFDVKTTSSHSGQLIVQLDGPEDMTYVLASCERVPDVMVHGWAHSSECMKPEFVRDPLGWRPAYFVPQSVLHPMGTLEHGVGW